MTAATTPASHGPMTAPGQATTQQRFAHTVDPVRP